MPSDEQTLHPLAKARLAKGWTRIDLASHTGLSLRTIDRLEDGAHDPWRVTRNVIAQALECDPSDIWPELEAAA